MNKQTQTIILFAITSSGAIKSGKNEIKNITNQSKKGIFLIPTIIFHSGESEVANIIEITETIEKNFASDDFK